jgi:hypothetical protein
MAYQSYRAYQQGASGSDLFEYAAKGYATMYLMKSIGDWAGPGPAARMMTGGVGGYLKTGDSEGFWRGFASGAVPNGFGIAEYKTDPFANFVLGVLSDGVRGYIKNGGEGARDEIYAGLVNNTVGHLAGYYNSRGARPEFIWGAWVYRPGEGEDARWENPLTIGNVISGSSDRLDSAWTWIHEFTHMDEQRGLGAFYLPVHGLSQGLGHLSTGWGNQGAFFMEQAPFTSVPYSSFW